MAHTLMVDDGNNNPVEVARGGLLYYPASADFKHLLGKPPKPLFEADNTQSTSDGTVTLTPPNTALGCAGMAVGQNGRLTKDAEFCNSGSDADNFMYLVPNDEGIYEAVSCKDAQKPVFKNKGYAGVSCKFPVPPVKKDPAPPSPAKGSEGSGAKPAASGPTEKGGGDENSGPVAVEKCKVDYITESYHGYQRLPAGLDVQDPRPSIGRWTVFATDGSDENSKANGDRLCVNNTGMVLLGGVVPPDGIVEGVKDAEGHDYMGFVVMDAQKWIPYEDRGANSQVAI